MPKKPSQEPEYSGDRETRVLLEEIRGQFRQFGEGLTDVQGKVSQIPEICKRLDSLEGEVKLVNTAVSSLAKEVQTVKTDVAVIRSTFATKKDLEEFNKRLTVVESR